MGRELGQPCRRFCVCGGVERIGCSPFRAVGPAGDHPIKVYSGYQAQSYLNYEQAPNAYLPRPSSHSGRQPAPFSAGFVYRAISAAAGAETEVKIAMPGWHSARRRVPWERAQCLRGEGFGGPGALQTGLAELRGAARVSGNGLRVTGKPSR